MRFGDIRDCCADVMDSSNERVVWRGYGEFIMITEPGYCVSDTDGSCWSSPNYVTAVVLYGGTQVKTRYAVSRPRSTGARPIMNKNFGTSWDYRVSSKIVCTAVETSIR